ncbi:protein-glutamate O-methyltransferase CheR [Sulfitobacter sp. M57]|uniref:CheR family methyltransferase n=1 Tax=unclassified Sulfitobacter TaxID=196795 RepID=UPI0023E29D20|nr:MULTISPECIES: protein-glutamate O-methyltransferase CheR [unclassified Sulfitobacter]MDF3413713.1 protein-glutamate O-methyltransferase CheR [Sulfitobacter sp. KE5]MDF3421006.1 protein-glutamate O-methyltransferase CheR [Sulfitobacter sp. KE43]MDF3432259.1 protein-glutamate O-methyltransferase CheR [Sulfitobacter sp. KE42]MDF3457898.1 protein-glutamate O-methyltransferase CheR [Sulfitobacter sp. S74]MDF3461799.1 protein-glutamate O-methyltransferase CheR [Sulfitobacter sp. Ks18]
MTSRRQDIASLDTASFRAIAALAYRESGLTLQEEKSPMIQSRLRHRLRDLGLLDFRSYCALIESDQGVEERQHLISALTTNVSHFFREEHHFETLKSEFDRCLPRLRAGGQMRVWSAGCSNGQEALSAAITLTEHHPDVAGLDVRILATDIDPVVVRFARQGVYPKRLLGGVPETLIRKYFQQVDSPSDEPHFRARETLKSMICFNELNLLGSWPMKKKFEVIFCRNVVIYFDIATQETLWPNFHAALTREGVLFLGHSERISDPVRFGFACTGATTYRPSTR